jgi:hypothetical protein
VKKNPSIFSRPGIPPATAATRKKKTKKILPRRRENCSEIWREEEFFFLEEFIFPRFLIRDSFGPEGFPITRFLEPRVYEEASHPRKDLFSFSFLLGL